MYHFNDTGLDAYNSDCNTLIIFQELGDIN